MNLSPIKILIPNVLESQFFISAVLPCYCFIFIFVWLFVFTLNKINDQINTIIVKDMIIYMYTKIYLHIYIEVEAKSLYKDLS